MLVYVEENHAELIESDTVLQRMLHEQKAERGESAVAPASSVYEHARSNDSARGAAAHDAKSMHSGAFTIPGGCLRRPGVPPPCCAIVMAI